MAEMSLHITSHQEWKEENIIILCAINSSHSMYAENHVHLIIIHSLSDACNTTIIGIPSLDDLVSVMLYFLEKCCLVLAGGMQKKWLLPNLERYPDAYKQ